MDEEEKIEIENIGWGECVNSFVDVCKRWKEEEIGRLMKGWNIKGINEVDKEGKTCMMYLCERGLEIYAIKILERGDFRMIDNIDELGDDIMIKACKNGMEELVLMMLERVNRININRVNKSNKTGLMYAIEKRMYKVADELIKRMRNINQVDEQGNTALMIGLNNVNSEMVNIIRKMFKRGDIEVNNINKRNNTALIIGCKRKQEEEIIKEIIMKSNIRTINYVNDEGKIALIYAIENKMEKVGIEILKYTDDIINMTDKYWNTILMKACYNEMSELSIEILRREDFNKINIKCKIFNNTALIIACSKRLEKVGIEILKYTDDIINMTDKYCRSERIPQLSRLRTRLS